MREMAHMRFLVLLFLMLSWLAQCVSGPVTVGSGFLSGGGASAGLVVKQRLCGAGIGARVASRGSKWKRHRLDHNLWLCAGLLLVSGDIHPNPGPTPNLNSISPCSLCSNPVRYDQDGLYCEVCLSWAHRVCVGMSLDAYYHWGQIDDGWVCPKCEAGVRMYISRD